MKIKLVLSLTAILISQNSLAQEDALTNMPSHSMDSGSDLSTNSQDCSTMEVWDYSMAMCTPLAMAGMPMRMVMLQYNSFFTQTFETGARGRDAFTVPNMFMTDVGSSVGERQYVNLNIMGTFERWTYPQSGYPEFLQIGEENRDHQPYVDAQHPHSSPIMGLTLSDTLSLAHDKDYLKFSLSPRGEATDGPVAFMHRPTGMINPDAPLGHHVGQDVGHISSSVIAATTRINKTTFELSAFNGTEPEPEKVDLPLARPNSYAARLTQQLTPQIYAMASAAFVKNPEGGDPATDVWRYSASIYREHALAHGWMAHNAFIWGLINGYDHTSSLNSFTEEFWLQKNAENIWGRIEALERTAAELETATVNTVANQPKYVTALTLGYTHKIVLSDLSEFGLGASLTEDLLPERFRPTYGGDPLTAKIFLQVSGMKMWDL